ncbi:COMPASS component SDC1 [Sporothrix schenckii 1099-18]|uniref:COMPASS component SDC1 n=1 Tax=Sporothrix schenckii 1099-18 TaxID=1397361 RepID=A0A0F2LVW1_SPOSC|nr:COMPASS component SDC1 [Sporothrix schenckii 1099-18]KJR81612.1 COMPASS component SDC1 [Sporothrix schenckii 1099-18]
MADHDIEGRPPSDGADTAPEGSVDASTGEIAMTDGAASPAPLAHTSAGRTGTPVRHTANGGERLESSSRAASAHPEASFTIPSEAPLHGAPVRQYINSKLTKPLLDGMKMIAKEQYVALDRAVF